MAYLRLPACKAFWLPKRCAVKAVLLRNKKGERFMEKYDPKRMELSTRDVVARSIYTEGQGRPRQRTCAAPI